MGLLTREMERRMLLWAFVDSTNNTLAVTQPIVVTLVSTNGNADDPGIEVVGDSYATTQGYFALTATTPGKELVNTSGIDFNSLDTTDPVTVAGIELWDSSDTPVRVAYAALTSPITIPAGQPYSIGSGQLKVKIT